MLAETLMLGSWTIECYDKRTAPHSKAWGPVSISGPFRHSRVTAEETEPLH